MSAKRAFYSLIQYMPDASREEVANVGVVLFVPETQQLSIHTSASLLRVRKFFRPDDRTLRRIKSGVRSLKHRLAHAGNEFSGEQDFVKFIEARADAVRLSTPRLMLVTDADRELHDLYVELVGDTDQLQTKRPTVNLPTRVAEVFHKLRMQGKVWPHGSIEVPTVGKRFQIAGAYQNGVRNYVRPESLIGRKASSRLPELGFNGELIHRHPIEDQMGRLVVLSATPGADPELEEQFRRTLAEFHVRFVPYRDTDQFAEEVEQTAH